MSKDEPVLFCPTCYASSWRVSRVRPEDRLQTWLWKLPIRCKNCRARVYASRSFVKALRAQEAAAAQAKTTAS